MTDRAERLAGYLDRTDGVTGEWGLAGYADCSSWPAGWIKQERPDVEFPDYKNEEEARALIAGYGSLERLWRDILGRYQIYTTTYPEIGDVGVIQMSWGASGCIFGAGGVCFIRATTGYKMLRPRSKYIQARFAL